MVKYAYRGSIMINFFNDFEHERPACRPWSLVPIVCVLVGLMTLVAIAFLAKYQQNKKQKTIEWHYPYIWIALPRTGNLS